MSNARSLSKANSFTPYNSPQIDTPPIHGPSPLAAHKCQNNNCSAFEVQSFRSACTFYGYSRSLHFGFSSGPTQLRTGDANGSYFLAGPCLWWYINAPTKRCHKPKPLDATPATRLRCFGGRGSIEIAALGIHMPNIY